MTTLTIRFIGLNLFVADVQNDTLHVLMPDAPGGGPKPGPAERHHAAVRYDDPAKPGTPKTVKINQTRIEIPSIKRQVSLPFQLGIVDLSTFWAPLAKVPPQLIAGGMRDRLNCHFVIPGGRVSAVFPMGIWHVTLPGTSVPVQMHFAPEVHCTAELVDSTLDLPATVKFGTANGLDRLRDNGGVSMKAFHVEDGELEIPPDCPTVIIGDRSDHFPAFFQLFDKTTGPDIFIDAIDPPDAVTCQSTSTATFARRPGEGITPFTCMSGGGELGP